MNLQQTSLDPSFMQNGQSNINGSTAPYNDQSASNMMMMVSKICILNMSTVCIATNGQLERIICVYLYNELHAMFDFQSAGSTACIKTTRYYFCWLDEYSYEILKVCLFGRTIFLSSHNLQ